MPILPESLPDSLPRVTVDGHTMQGEELLAAGAAVADRIHGRPAVGVYATPTLSTVVAVVGALLAGVPFVPIPPDIGERELRHILTDASVGTVLGSPPDWWSQAETWAPTDVVPIDPDARSTATWTEPECGTAMIMYTSGTTGPPKGAVLSRSAMAADLDGLRDAWAWTPDDVLVHGLPLFHVHGLVLGVFGALRVGSPLVHTGRPTPEAYAAARGTLYFGVPTVWGRVAADASCAAALRSARLLVSGSAGLPAPVFDALVAHAGQGPVERYGMTETLITLAARVDGERRPGWVGTPLSGVQTRIVDDVGSLVGPDEVGMLHVRGSTLFDGYLGHPESAVGTEGWFVTGDAALVDDAGNHRIVGRAKDDLISSGGHRIGAGEIEAALLAHPSVEEVAVIGVPDDDLGQRIVAYVVCSDPTPAGASVLIEHVVSDLSRHKRPREIRFVDSLPRNAMGKIQKSRLDG